MKNSYTNSSRNKVAQRSIVINMLKSSVKDRIFKKFQTNRNKYNIKIINDIIYNEKANIVGKFKDYLIYDDTSEFLKRYYKKKETIARLPKIYEFYVSYSKIFPNYTSLSEARYIYKNIQKKQKMIDKLQKNVQREFSKEDEKEDKIFSTKVYNSLMELSLYSYHKNSMFNNTSSNKKTGEDSCSTESLVDIIDNINIAEEFTQKIRTDRKSKTLTKKTTEKKKEGKSSNSKDKKILNKKSSNINLGPSTNKEAPEEKNLDPNNKDVLHKATLSVPKLPINTINNHIYNNFNIINNIQYEFSPKIKSSRLVESRNYQTNQINKKTPSGKKEVIKSQNNNLVSSKIAQKLSNKLDEIQKGKNTPTLLNSHRNVTSSKPERTLISNHSTKNLLINSTNINLRNHVHNENVGIPQTARIKTKDDSKDFSNRHIFSFKSNESTSTSKNIQSSKYSSMSKATSNYIKKEIFNKINSDRQNSNPKNTSMKRNNSEIYNSLNKNNNIIVNYSNNSKSKFSVNNSNYCNNKKTSIIKESINLYKEINKDLFSPRKNIEINVAKNNFISKPQSKNGSISSRIVENKNTGIKNLKNIKKDLKTSYKKPSSGIKVSQKNITNKK